jgi:hypothetical protein
LARSLSQRARTNGQRGPLVCVGGSAVLAVAGEASAENPCGCPRSSPRGVGTAVEELGCSSPRAGRRRVARGGRASRARWCRPSPAVRAPAFRSTRVGRRVKERHGRRLPSSSEHGHDRGWAHRDGSVTGGPGHGIGVSGRRPAQKLVTAHEPRGVVAQDEGAVGELVEGGVVVALGTGVGEPLRGQLSIERRRGRPVRERYGPVLDEARVVLVATLGAWAMARGKRRRVVIRRAIACARSGSPGARPRPPSLDASMGRRHPHANASGRSCAAQSPRSSCVQH